MADIKSLYDVSAKGPTRPTGKAGGKSPVDPLFLREEALREAMGLLFLVYRDFTSRPDALLEPLNLGRAHHRILYFVGRRPGINIGELLDVLQITKQSLSRVLKELLELEYVEPRKSVSDGRVRQLFLTAKGQELEKRLAAVQSELLVEGFSQSGPEAVAGFRDVLLALTDHEDHERLGVLDSHKPATRRSDTALANGLRQR